MDIDMKLWILIWTCKYGHGNMDMEIWKRGYNNKNMDMEICFFEMWKWKYGYGNMDMEVWIWRYGYGCGSMDLENNLHALVQGGNEAFTRFFDSAYLLRVLPPKCTSPEKLCPSPRYIHNFTYKYRHTCRNTCVYKQNQSNIKQQKP